MSLTSHWENGGAGAIGLSCSGISDLVDSGTESSFKTLYEDELPLCGRKYEAYCSNYFMALTILLADQS